MSDRKRSTQVVGHLPVQRRRTEYGDGEVSESRTVNCPLSHGSVSFEHCQNCEQFISADVPDVGEAKMSCHLPAEALASVPDSAALLDKLRQTTVHTIMASTVTCLDSELDLGQVAHVLDKSKLCPMPVVEDAGVLLGLISPGDLLHVQEEGLPLESTGLLAEDVMATEIPKLRETASLLEAIRIFGDTAAEQLPVVTQEDVVVGVLSVTDLMRWIAAQSTAHP